MGSYDFHGFFHQSFYGGAGASLLTGSRVTETALGGHPYMIDWSADIPLDHQSIPVTRAQADQSDSPGEQSINPEALWRRSIESWHLGAGQEFFDRPESTPFRYRSSKGIDPWTRWEFSLLNDTTNRHSTAATNLYTVVAGTRLYLSDGQTLVFWDGDLTVAPTTVTGTPASDVTSLASDGFHVWAAYGANGVYRTDTSSGAAVQYVSDPVTLVRYAAGRVLAFEGAAAYDISAEAFHATPPNPLPAALFTHLNDDWTWVDAAASSTHIFMGGFSGDKSIIYATTILEDATALEVPVVVSELPFGEVLTSFATYLGQFAGIGVDVLGDGGGWRFAAVQEGQLSLSSLVPTPAPVRAWGGDGRFMWFGWEDFDGTSSGVGRLDTSVFGDPDGFVPAYASDLMADQTGQVLSISNYEVAPGLRGRVFTVVGQGLYAEIDSLVGTGHIDSGFVTYGMTEPKLGLFIDVDHVGDNLGGVETLIRTEIEDTFANLDLHFGPSEDADLPIALGEISSTQHEFRFVLTPDVDGAAQVFNSWMFRVQPRTQPSRMILATVLLTPDTETLTDIGIYSDPYEELEHIVKLWQEQRLTSWQQHDRAWSVFVEDFQLVKTWLMTGLGGQRGFNGSMLVRLKVVD